MENVGNEADDQVRRGDFCVEVFFVFEIEAEGGGPRVAAGQGGRLGFFEIADPDADVGTLEEIPDEGSGDETGAENEKCFNGRPPCREWSRGISAGTGSPGSAGRGEGSWPS